MFPLNIVQFQHHPVEYVRLYYFHNHLSLLIFAAIIWDEFNTLSTSNGLRPAVSQDRMILLVNFSCLAS